MNNPTLETIRPLRNSFAYQLIPHGEMTRGRKRALEAGNWEGGIFYKILNKEQMTAKAIHELICSCTSGSQNTQIRFSTCIGDTAASAENTNSRSDYKSAPAKAGCEELYEKCTRQMRIRELEELFLTEAAGRALCPVMGP